MARLREDVLQNDFSLQGRKGFFEVRHLLGIHLIGFVIYVCPLAKYLVMAPPPGPISNKRICGVWVTAATTSRQMFSSVRKCCPRLFLSVYTGQNSALVRVADGGIIWPLAVQNFGKLNPKTFLSLGACSRRQKKRPGKKNFSGTLWATALFSVIGSIRGLLPFLILFAVIVGIGSFQLHELVVKPSSMNGAGHWPINNARWSFFIILAVADNAIEPRAAHRNTSEGTFAVCFSIALATGPS